MQVRALNPASIRRFWSRPSAITFGQSAELCYQMSGAERGMIEPAIGTLQVLDQSCVRVTPSQSTRYSLTAAGSDGVGVSAVAEVRVSFPPATIERFSADPNPARRGERINLCYSVTNAIEGEISPLGRIDLQQRCVSTIPQETTTYLLRVRGRDNMVESPPLTVLIIGTGTSPGSVVGRHPVPPQDTSPTSALPDLIAQLTPLKRVALSDGKFQVPVRVTVINQGASPAGTFKISLQVDGRYSVPFTVAGQADRSYPSTVAPLSPRGSVSFEGTAYITGPGNRTISLTAKADSCDGDEIAMNGFCRVRESDEQNNTSNALSISLPSTPIILKPRGTDRVINPKSVPK